jgi:hypothetical protein
MCARVVRMVVGRIGLTGEAHGSVGGNMRASGQCRQAGPGWQRGKKQQAREGEGNDADRRDPDSRGRGRMRGKETLYDG